jgi:hypothetical protein
MTWPSKGACQMAEPRTSSGGCYGVHVVHVAGRSTQTKQNPSKTRALLKKGKQNQ